MQWKEYIERKAAIDEIDEWYELYLDSDAAREALSMAKRAIKKLPAADAVPREAYAQLQEENTKLKNQVWSLKKKIREMKSDASWEEDIRRGQVQGMW